MAGIGIFNYNVGWSNKASTVPWDKIVDGVYDLAASVVVLTEVSSVRKIAALAKKLSHQHERTFDSVAPKIGYDRIALLYDCSRFTLVSPYEVSCTMKTAAFDLARTDGGGTINVVAVHAPYKSNKRLDTLARLNAMLGDGGLPTVVVGDVNTGPVALKTALTYANAIAITNNAHSTTETGTPAVDNIATSEGTIQDVDVLHNMSGSDHYPMVATWGS